MSGEKTTLKPEQRGSQPIPFSGLSLSLSLSLSPSLSRGTHQHCRVNAHPCGNKSCNQTTQPDSRPVDAPLACHEDLKTKVERRKKFARKRPGSRCEADLALRNARALPPPFWGGRGAEI